MSPVRHQVVGQYIIKKGSSNVYNVRLVAHSPAEYEEMPVDGLEKAIRLVEERVSLLLEECVSLLLMELLGTVIVDVVSVEYTSSHNESNGLLLPAA